MPTFLYINFIFLCVCVSTFSCYVLKMDHQCGFQCVSSNSFMDPFQSLKLQQIKGTWIFSLVREIS